MIRAKDLADSYMVTWMRVADVTVLSVGALTFSSDPRFSVIHVPRYLYLYTHTICTTFAHLYFPCEVMHGCVPWQLCQVSAAFQQSCLVKQWKESINKEAQEMLTMPDGYIDDVCSVEFPHNYSTKWDCGVALDSLDSILSSLWDLSHFSPSCCWPSSRKKSLSCCSACCKLTSFAAALHVRLNLENLISAKSGKSRCLANFLNFQQSAKYTIFLQITTITTLPCKHEEKTFRFAPFATQAIIFSDSICKVNGWRTTKKNRRFCHAEHILDR